MVVSNGGLATVWEDKYDTRLLFGLKGGGEGGGGGGEVWAREETSKDNGEGEWVRGWGDLVVLWWVGEVEVGVGVGLGVGNG